MKNIFKILIVILSTTSLLNSCTGSENNYVAIRPVDGELLINPTVNDVVLSKENKDETAISFSWDVTDYNLNTPLQYTVEIDGANGDFSDPETAVTESTELSLTHARLNTIALSKDLIVNIKGEIKVRVKTSLKYDALPSYSKVETIKLTPYEDLVFPLPASGELYLQGDAVPSNWGYPIPEAQKMTRVPNKPIFTIRIELIGNRKISFISSNQNWSDPAYKALAADQPVTGGSFIESGASTTPPWAGGNINTLPNTHKYEITVNFTTGKYTAEVINDTSVGTVNVTGCKIPSNMYPPDTIVIGTHSSYTKAHYPKRIAIFKNNPLSENDIVFLGNSITEQGGDWGHRLKNNKVKNRGISGDTTEGVLARLGELTFCNPKQIFILIGINDLFRDDMTPEKVFNNILKIVNTIHEGAPNTQIFVQTILPTDQEKIKKKIESTNTLLMNSESKEPYELIDLHEEFVDSQNDNDLMNMNLSGDGVHLNDEGYKVWVKKVIDLIK